MNATLYSMEEIHNWNLMNKVNEKGMNGHKSSHYVHKEDFNSHCHVDNCTTVLN